MESLGEDGFLKTGSLNPLPGFRKFLGKAREPAISPQGKAVMTWVKPVPLPSRHNMAKLVRFLPPPPQERKSIHKEGSLGSSRAFPESEWEARTLRPF